MIKNILANFFKTGQNGKKISLTKEQKKMRHITRHSLRTKLLLVNLDLFLLSLDPALVNLQQTTTRFSFQTVI